MERLQTAVLAACAISMLTGILQLLRPNEKFDRQLRLFTAGLMLISILMPLLQGIQTLTPDWSLLESPPSYESSDFAEQVRQQTASQVESNLEQTLQAELQIHGINVKSLSVTVHISEEDRIDISSVTVISDTPAAAKHVLQAYLGEEVEIIVESIERAAEE